MTWAHLPDALIAAWPGLSPSAKAVAVALASHMDRKGKCFPSRARIMERSGLRCAFSVSQAIRELQAAGVLSVHRRQRQASVYLWREFESRENLPSNNLESRENRPHESRLNRLHNILTEHKEPRRRKTPAPGVSNPWAAWVDVWREHFNGSKPDPANLGRHASAAKAVAKLVKDDSEVRRVFAAYLADQDPYLVRNGHGLALILGRIDAYREVNADHMERIFR